MRSILTLAVLFLFPACADTPTALSAPGPVQVSVVAAASDFVLCGAEIPVTATVLNDRGRPVAGFLLNFNAVAGGGSIFGGAELTNSKGVAKDIWTVGMRPNATNTLAVRAVDASTGAGTTFATLSHTTLTKIAFTGAENSYIYTMYADGTEIDRLELEENNSVSAMTKESPAWSPDGSKIVFRAHDGAYTSAIVVMNADSPHHTIQLTTGSDYDPAWSPDGKRIAFARYGVAGYLTLYVMNADGTGQTYLSDPSLGTRRRPAWSPDGSKIAVDNNADIYIMNADATNEIRLTSDGTTGIDRKPVWSPDGSKIAFESKGSVYYDIYVMDANGTNRTRVFRDSNTAGSPTWSPDGSKIAFKAFEQGVGEAIYAINVDGTNKVLLSGMWGPQSPAWSGCTAF